jgi:predicted DCC family thiol-disulfide oxidoreductase YuxK
MAAPEIYYDGGCPVCSREIAFYQARPGSESFRWVDVTRQDALLGAGLTRQEALARMHVRRKDGTLLSGAAAFAEIWRHMPGLRWLGHLLRVPPLGLVAEGAYRVFLVLRRLWR